MTYIKKLVMDGFKSFGKRTEIVFENNFNVVLGPNGSGKSNVGDAICFVLGRLSSKSLRAEKLANLLYNGGKEKKPAQKGEVSLYFDNKDGTFPTEDETVKITRIVSKKGQSQYKINDQHRTRTQILDLMSVAKINPDGYNIVMQGDIVHLVEMSPIERREIIEQLSGISVYEEKKHKALLALEKVEEKLNEAKIVLKERKSHLAELKKERDQALKFKELSDKIKSGKASLIKGKMERKEAEFGESEKKRKVKQDELDRINESISNSKKKIDVLRKDIKGIEKEIEEKGEVEQISIQKEIEQLRVDSATKKTMFQTCKGEIMRLDERISQLKKQEEEIRDAMSNAEKDIAKQNDAISGIKDEVNELEEKIITFRKKHNIDQDTASIEDEIAKIDENSEQLQGRVQDMRQEQQDLLREKDRIEYQIKTIEERINKVMTLEAEHKEEISNLKNMRQEFKNLTLELNKLLTKDSRLAADLGKLRESLRQEKESLARLEGRSAHVQEAIGANIAVKKILEKKIHGVFGTISQLGTVDSAYADAMEVAAGKRAQSIVVKDDRIAADCIKYLKQERLGTASFLPLNKMKKVEVGKETRELSKFNGVKGLAIDLIDFDPALRRAFEHVFSDTIIVESIDVARRIGIGNARMVSLEGDLAEKSGAMVGGFRQRKKTSGTFQEKSLLKELEKKEKEVEKLEHLLAGMEEDKEETENKIAEIRQKKAEMEGDMIKKEKSLHLDTEDLQASESYKEDCRKKAKETEDRLASLQKSILDVNRELAAEKMKKQQLRDRITQLRNPVLLAELNTFEERKRQLEQQRIAHEAVIQQKKLQSTEVWEREQGNLGKALSEAEKEGGRLKAEEEKLSAAIKGIESLLKEKEEKQKKFYAKFKSLYDTRNRKSSELQDMENLLFRSEEDARKEEHVINIHSLEEAKLKAELMGLKEDFSQYSGIELDMNSSEEDLQKKVEEAERMQEKIGMVNLKSLDVYESIEKEYNKLVGKKENLHKEKDSVSGMIAEIDEKKKEVFMSVFNVINGHFKQMFDSLSTKGQASLVLENSDSPFEGGMGINVNITGDKFLDIRSLSGGEKTMTALAFLFAVQEHEPASFYILDEVDAALDKHNSEKLAKLIRRYCGHAQYVVVSHNDAVISEGDNLFGVSMDEHGMSKVVSIKL